MKMRAFLLVALAAVIVAAAVPVIAQEAAPSFSFPIKGGKVNATFESGVYTYMDITAGQTRFWIVAPVCSVKEGDAVSVMEGKYYASVYSEGLGITFDNLVVGTKLEINGQVAEAFKAHDLPSGCAIRRPANQ